MNLETKISTATPNSRSAYNLQLGFFLFMLATGYISIAASQLALGFSLMAMVYRWVIRKELPPPTGLEKTTLVLALWALLMIPLSTNVPQSALYYRRFYLFTAIWVGAGLATSEHRRLLLLGYLLGGALLISLYGQIYHLINYGALFNHRMSIVFNAMTGGAMLMMAAMLAIGFLVLPNISRRVKMAITLAILPVVLGLVMSATRSAFLGAIAGLGIILLLVKPRVFWVFLGLIVLTGLVVGFFGENLVPEQMWKRISPEYLTSGASTTVRLEMWKGSLEIIKAHPITGVGDRGLAEISPDYYTAPSGKYFGHLHSNIFHMAAIWGIPGLIFGQTFLWAGLWLLVKRWRELRRDPANIRNYPLQQGWVLGAIGVWVSFYIAGFTDWYFGDAEPMLIYFAILGCALGVTDPAEKKAD